MIEINGAPALKQTHKSIAVTLVFCAAMAWVSGSFCRADRSARAATRSTKLVAKAPTAPAPSAWHPVLGPRHVALPPADPKAGTANPIDRLLAPYYTGHKIPPVVPVDDRTFARRATLDLIGTLPPESDLRAFLADKSVDKRQKLVTRLLGDNARYAEHWLSFWNDMLRNDYTGTGYIDGGRAQITDWLYSALATNMPYNRFVTELVDPKPESPASSRGSSGAAW